MATKPSLDPRKLKVARINAGLSQAELAAKLHKSITGLSGWETGFRSPTVPSIYGLAYILGVPFESLITDDSASA